ncbi:putative cytoplasmic protein [Pseudodesulfovibrio mercurii]|uniref:Putative cytoplasmic protein n=1 Tax=Pseudodesulfovibrio mercurii TaxID=641491 RepID=F0JCF6_9BACT|nr:DUF364 domain-containing protein [Pseudodesulfovibrio mercurii]EGB14454.1 putative cytoplasmic protein [Pseudodesulfovibrio mercurii]
MGICGQLVETMQTQAEGRFLENLTIGLGYTAVCTDDGGVGVAYTPESNKGGCSVLPPNEEYEGRPASEVLELLLSNSALHRTIGLALVNALNHAQARTLPEDRNNSVLFDALGIVRGTRVAMVGHFAPIVARLEERGSLVEVVDRGKGLGDEQRFTERLESWAEVAIVTSTSIINNTLDDLLARMGKDVRVALMGPSTPLLKAPFQGKVRLLAGTVPMDSEATLRAVRQAKGTPVIQKFSRKPLLVVA